jgi:tRNA uridine 5-carbamoylmethylation protein Kti12
MKFLVISGAPETGKTTAINKIAEWLTAGVITTDYYGKTLPSFLPNKKGEYEDFSIVIILNNRKIIIHSATDDEACMDGLIEEIRKNTDTEIVITSCRDLYKQRDYFTSHIKPFATFFLESPLGKITRRNDPDAAKNWYENTLFLLHKHILSNNPFNL